MRGAPLAKPRENRKNFSSLRSDNKEWACGFMEAALIVQDYRPAGTDTIEWMAQCDHYRELAMMDSYCLLELTTRNKEKSRKWENQCKPRKHQSCLSIASAQPDLSKIARANPHRFARFSLWTQGNPRGSLRSQFFFMLHGKLLFYRKRIKIY